MSRSTKRPIYIIKASLSNVTSSEETTLQLPAFNGVNFRAEIWELVSVRFVRTAGTAANYRLRLGKAATWTDGDVDEIADFGSLVVGTAINDVFAQGVPFQTDSNNRFYMRPGFDDATADHDADYEFYLRHATGS